MKLNNNKIRIETFFQGRSNPAAGQLGLTLICDNFKTTNRGPHWQQEAESGQWSNSGHRSIVVSANDCHPGLCPRVEIVKNHLIIKKFDSSNLAIKQKIKLSLLSLSNRFFLKNTSNPYGRDALRKEVQTFINSSFSFHFPLGGKPEGKGAKN